MKCEELFYDMIFKRKSFHLFRNIGEGSRTILRRKREQAIVNDKGILLESDDVILLGKISYDVTIVY